MANEEHMLTTVDNPHDPFTEWDAWYAFDARKGYNTPAYLARVAATSDELSDVDHQLIIEEAIDEIIEVNGSEMYKKVTRQTGGEPEISSPVGS